MKFLLHFASHMESAYLYQGPTIPLLANHVITTDEVLMKRLTEMYLITRKSPSNSESHPESDIPPPWPNNIPSDHLTY